MVRVFSFKDVTSEEVGARMIGYGEDYRFEYSDEFERQTIVEEEEFVPTPCSILGRSLLTQDTRNS